jgi:hypothetical protein
METGGLHRRHSPELRTFRKGSDVWDEYAPADSARFRKRPKAVMARRDKIVTQFQKMISEKGEKEVLY